MDTRAGRHCCRVVDGEVRRLAEPVDAGAVLASGGQALGPGLGLALAKASE